MPTKEQILEAANIGRVKEKTASKTELRKEGVEKGLKGEQLDLAVKMKRGCGNSVQISLDGDPNSEAYISFRVLSVNEEGEIAKKMQESGFAEGSKWYTLMLSLERLALATTPPPSKIEHTLPQQPAFTAHELGKMLSEGQLIALGLVYNDFLMKHNPDLNNYTEDDVNALINDIAEAVADPKLAQTALPVIYRECNMSLIFAALIKSVTTWKELMLQADK